MFSFTKHAHYFLNRELSELYLSFAIRTFALSMISIFVPLYLLNLGYSLVNVLAFYLMFAVFHGFLTIFATKLSLKIGFKHSIGISMPFLILVYILLYTLPTYNWPLMILSLVGAISSAIFWLSFHVDFAKSSVKRIRGQEVGILRIVTFALNVIGPLVGALIISFIGFYYLFIFVSSLLVISLVPLFYSKEIHTSQKVSLKRVLKISSWKNFLVFMGNGTENAAANVIWPVFIFLIAGGYLTLGIITSLATFFSLLTVFIVSRMCDRFKRSRILKFGSIAQSLAWFFKSIVSTVPQIVIINSFSSILNTFKDIPYTALVYDKANKRNIVEFIVLREIGISLGRVVFFALMILLAFLYQGLIVAGVASLTYLLF